MSSSSGTGVPLTYIAQKNTESGYELLKAASLPYENFCEKDGGRIPALIPTPEAQLTDAIVLDAGYDAAGFGYLEFIPDLYGGLAMTNDSSALTFPTLSGEVVYRYPENLGLGGRIPPEYFVLKDTNTGTLSAHGGSYRFTASSPDMGIGLNSVVATATQVNGFKATCVGFGGYPVMYVQALIGGAWADVGSVDLRGGFWEGTLPNFANYVAIRVTFSAVDVVPNATGKVKFSWEFAANPPQGYNGWSSLKTYPFPYLSGLPAVQSFRRIAGSLLATYTGADLVNGGQIASALVPSNWCPPTDDPFSSVAELRNDRFDGPLKFGTDVTWRPHDLDDLLSMNADTFVGASSKIVVGYQIDTAATSSMRVRAFGLVGVYSTNPIVGRMIYSPAMTPQMLEALSLYYQNTPTCTNNKTHVAVKAIKNMGTKTLKVLRTLLEHDSMIAAMLTAAGQPEAAMGVKLAGSVSRSVANSNRKQKKPAPSAPKAKQKARR